MRRCVLIHVQLKLDTEHGKGGTRLPNSMGVLDHPVSLDFDTQTRAVPRTSESFSVVLSRVDLY